jgi:hypothetical protein
MMKHTGTLSLGLGLFFAVPAMTFGGGLPDSVETALNETLHALEVLRQLETKLEKGEPLGMEDLVQVTEGPLGDERQRDERLSDLRNEVAELQAKADRKKLEEGIPMSLSGSPSTTPHGPTGPDGNTTSMPAPTNRPLSTKGVSPGLSETFIKALGSGQIGPQPASPANSDPQAGPSSQPTADTPVESKPTEMGTKSTAKTPSSPEGEGYSANPLRQAQACFHAKRYEQGLSLLEAVESSPTIDYWKARLLERLNRFDEAITLYTTLETSDEATELRETVKRDREFAEWRRDFLKKAGLDTENKEKKGS